MISPVWRNRRCAPARTIRQRTGVELFQCCEGHMSHGGGVRLPARSRTWDARFDARQHSDHEWPDAASRVAWTEEGSHLSDAVRDELGPGYDVQYFHELP
ncbi:MAG: hypothetical protein ACXVW3_02355 [Nocardioidaceae bacterium]